MSEALIRVALEKRLLPVVGTAHTVFENQTYTPTTNVPYQNLHHLFNAALDRALTIDVVERSGVLWVKLFYPLGNGRLPAQTLAAAIAAQFKPVQTLVEGAIKVEITRTAEVAQGTRDGDRWMVPVSVEWRSFSP